VRRESEQGSQWEEEAGPLGWKNVSDMEEESVSKRTNGGRQWVLARWRGDKRYLHIWNTLFSRWSGWSLAPSPTSSLAHSLSSVLSDQFQISTWFFICSLFNALMMEAVCTFETSVHFEETIWCYIPQGCLLHTHCHENLKSHNYSQRLNIPLQKYKTNKILLTINLNMI
jgi:hypothetical protein